MTTKNTQLVQDLTEGSRAGVGGLLCNDATGLCISAHGPMDAANAGVYTSLTRLAAQLQQSEPAPLITIECDDSAVIVKDFDGHAVAVRVPKEPKST